MANATNAVALVPGSFAGMLGFRRELGAVPRWMRLLTIPSLLGGGIGALLLLHTSERTFERIVPLLILGATLLFAFQGLMTPRAHEPTRGWIAFVFIFQLLVGIYGGYFGAGMGILMLAALGLIGMTDLHQMNGLKNLLAICINGVAAIWFTVSGAVIWPDALLMAVASILGGYAGARIAQRLGRKFVRWFVVAIGFSMAIALFFK